MRGATYQSGFYRAGSGHSMDSGLGAAGVTTSAVEEVTDRMPGGRGTGEVLGEMTKASGSTLVIQGRGM